MNIFTLNDFSTTDINSILDEAEEFKAGKKVDFKGKKVVANLFFASSTDLKDLLNFFTYSSAAVVPFPSFSYS